MANINQRSKLKNVKHMKLNEIIEVTDTHGIVRRLIGQFESTNTTFSRSKVFTKLSDENNSIKRTIEKFEAVNVTPSYNSRNKFHSNEMTAKKTITNATFSYNLPIKFRPIELAIETETSRKHKTCTFNMTNMTELHSSPAAVSSFISDAITKSLGKYGQKRKETVLKPTNVYSNPDFLASGNVKRLTRQFETYLTSALPIPDNVKRIIEKFEINDLNPLNNSENKLHSIEMTTKKSITNTTFSYNLPLKFCPIGLAIETKTSKRC